jgi:hypothetical protein
MSEKKRQRLAGTSWLTNDGLAASEMLSPFIDLPSSFYPCARLGARPGNGDSRDFHTLGGCCGCIAQKKQEILDLAGGRRVIRGAAAGHWLGAAGARIFDRSE